MARKTRGAPASVPGSRCTRCLDVKGGSELVRAVSPPLGDAAFLLGLSQLARQCPKLFDILRAPRLVERADARFEVAEEEVDEIAELVAFREIPHQGIVRDVGFMLRHI